MEIQIPLILFVAFCAASAGIFASQAVLALKGEGKEVQVPSLIASLAALAIGGISVLFHLAQPLHIFNGFGNPTSGITQELVAIVIFAVIMLVYFIMLRRNENEVPKWCAVLAIIISVVLVIVCSHSYMMSSRPAWDTFIQILSVLGGACAVGPAVVAAVAGFVKVESKTLPLLMLIGAAIGLVTTLIYLVVMQGTGSSFTTFGTTYIDPTNPTAVPFDASAVSAFSGEAVAPTWIAIIAGIAAVICAYMARRTNDLKVWGIATAVCALVCAIALRITFYVLGFAIYNFYGITG
jgi:anaerobic dimethyl sulfoxide reductase subunit C (anchor subunit)